MKFFVCFVLAAIFAVAMSSPVPEPSEAEPYVEYAEAAADETQRFKKSYGGGGHGLPCPKNIVVGCQTHASKIPCKSGYGGGHGGHGSYSHYAPQYAPVPTYYYE